MVKEVEPVINFFVAHAMQPAVVLNSTFDRELVNKCDFLRHVANSMQWYPAGILSEHANLATVNSFFPNDGIQERRLATTAWTQEPIAEI